MQALNKYVDLGRPLTISEVDDNWQRLMNAVANIEAGNLPIRGVALVENESGQYLSFLDENGDQLALIPFPAAILQSGAWTAGAAYTTRNIVTYDGGTFLCAIAHAAGVDFWDDIDANKWIQLGSAGATAVDFDPGSSVLTSDTVQDAILELLGMIETAGGATAAQVSYDKTASGLSSTNVQGAIDEVVGKAAMLEAAFGDLNATGVGLNPVTGTTATNVQQAIAEIFGIIDSGTGGSDDQTAVEVPFTPASGIAATNVQAAIVEVKGMIPASSGGSAADVSYGGAGMAWLNFPAHVKAALDGANASLQSLSDSISSFSVSADQVTYGASNVALAIADLDNALSSLQADNVGYGGGYSTVRAALDDILTRLAALEAA